MSSFVLKSVRNSSTSSMCVVGVSIYQRFRSSLSSTDARDEANVSVVHGAPNIKQLAFNGETLT